MSVHIKVKREAGDHQIAIVDVKDLEDIRWDTVSGGVHTISGQSLLYGYTYCNKFIEGEVAHSCTHGPAPHRIKVFIPMCLNSKKVIDQFKQIADQKSKRKLNRKSCIVADEVRKIVKKNPDITPAEVKKQIPQCSAKEVDNAIHYLKKHKFSNKENLVSVKYRNTQKLRIE